MTTTALSPDPTPPPGTAFVDTWGSGGPDRRVVLGVEHAITDSEISVATSCIQHRDGHVDDGTADEGPGLYFSAFDTPSLNSDQARELAAKLLELAAQIDGWVTR